MANQTAPWPKQGPASYFPSIEKKYGRSIAEWQKIITDSGLDKHMAIVGHLKSEYGMGHGHANALVGWTLSGNTAGLVNVSDATRSAALCGIRLARWP